MPEIAVAPHEVFPIRAKTPARVTDALVLAAGKGTRLGQVSKPLYPLVGVPLLARTLFTLEQAGIEDAYVVIGYNGALIREGIDAIERLKIRVRWIDNPRWEEPNGVSVLAAEAHLDGPFVMTMSDQHRHGVTTPQCTNPSITPSAASPSAR